MITRTSLRLLGHTFILAALLSSCGRETSNPTDEPIQEEPSMVATNQRDIIANNAFFYYSDLEKAWRFYEDILGLETVADYGFAKIMQVASTSYLTLVDAESGMHTADEPKTVAIALITDELDEWHQYLSADEIRVRSRRRTPASRICRLRPGGLLPRVRTVQSAPRE